jgi:hypothetical protein
MAQPKRASNTVVIAALLFSSSAFAASPPKEDCRSVSRLEYNTAKNENIIISKGGRYVRTRPFWRRYYWHCPV